MEQSFDNNSPNTGHSAAENRALKPESLHFGRGPLGELRLSIDGDDRSYLNVRIAHAFPLSAPTRYIGLIDCRGRSIGLIEDLCTLTPETRRVVQDELLRSRSLRRLLKVTRIHHDRRTM